MRPSLCESLLAESRRGDVELEEISIVENVIEENVNDGGCVKVSGRTNTKRGLERAEERQMEIKQQIQKARQLAESALSPQPKPLQSPSSPPQRNPQSFELSQSPTGCDVILEGRQETKAGE